MKQNIYDIFIVILLHGLVLFHFHWLCIWCVIFLIAYLIVSDLHNKCVVYFNVQFGLSSISLWSNLDSHNFIIDRSINLNLPFFPH